MMVSSLQRILNTPIRIAAIFPLGLDPNDTNDKMAVKDVWSIGKHQTKALLTMEEFQLLYDLIQTERLRTNRSIRKQHSALTPNSSSSDDNDNNDNEFDGGTNDEEYYPEPWIFVNDVEEDAIWNAEWWSLSLDRYLSNFNLPKLEHHLAVALDYLDEEPRLWMERNMASFTSMPQFYHEFLTRYGNGPEPYYKQGTVWPPPFSPT